MAQKDFIFKKLFSSPLGPQEIGREINVGPKDILIYEFIKGPKL